MNYTYTIKHCTSLCLIEAVAIFWYSFVLMIKLSATIYMSLRISVSTVALLFAATVVASLFFFGISYSAKLCNAKASFGGYKSEDWSETKAKSAHCCNLHEKEKQSIR